MLRFLLPVFIIIPAIEVGLFIVAGQYIGIPATIGMILLTGIIGAWLAKREGLHTLNEFRLKMSRGELPGESLMDGGCIIAGGALLLTPGFLTDAIGFFLLFPPTRLLAKRLLKRKLKSAYENGQFSFYWRK
ncbi:FxsA family protein [Fictibacillus aquaticus]|uniref:Membrane protein FxsA n=1 Tax=Fictibacillus aquaticus TaxID=2021314 RepID=A0A235FA57_9BACL|nr:FxsA family protein [Fictibacillus aquaticus]OYD58178.1 membrane protein FxsA [Fictibacillus aquaticus]